MLALQDVALQAAAGNDFAKDAEPSTSTAAPELTVSQMEKANQQPSTAGDALLAAQLQEEDQVKATFATDVATASVIQKCLACRAAETPRLLKYSPTSYCPFHFCQSKDVVLSSLSGKLLTLAEQRSHRQN